MAELYCIGWFLKKDFFSPFRIHEEKEKEERGEGKQKKINYVKEKKY